MKIAVLLSGGVDSSVALRLLRKEGHEVVAFYLKIWLEDELAHLGDCPWEEDLRHARGVCEAAGVRLEVVSLQREYHARVVSEALAELRAGRTPSPDVLCNRRIKFGAFFDRLAAAPGLAGFDKIASGHYARIRRSDGGFELLRGVDPVKDQTYFLAELDQRQLARLLFPVGAYPKAEVRRLAEGYGLPNAGRRDSQGLCFLGKIRYDDFVRAYLGERPGEIREVASGRWLGSHRGFWFHTIGQRRGLGLSGGPWYVVEKDAAENVVYVAHGEDLPHHERRRFSVPVVHWIGERPASDRLEVKLRHSPTAFECRVEPADGGGLDVCLDAEDPGIAAGQWAVFYHGERCLGGGPIGERTQLG